MKKDDSLWKALLEDLFPEFLRFFYPDADKLFNMHGKFEFLDKELLKLFPVAENGGQKFVDKLVKVPVKEGEEQWILVHIEVQGYNDRNFPLRMFQYYYRILDRYRRQITAIAIFTGKAKKIPDHFEQEYMGTRIWYGYNVYHIYDQDDEALKASNNPFALIVLAAKTALLSGKVTDQELVNQHSWIFEALQAWKLPKRKILGIRAFLQNCVQFADAGTYRTFEDKLETITGKKESMGVVEYLKEQGREEGLQRGRTEGLQKGRTEGLQKGRTEGITEGLQRGRTEGREEGLQESQERFVVNLLGKLHLSDEQIADIAEVSLAFVKRVKRKLRKK